jgi:hypothetical protein
MGKSYSPVPPTDPHRFNFCIDWSIQRPTWWINCSLFLNTNKSIHKPIFHIYLLSGLGHPYYASPCILVSDCLWRLLGDLPFFVVIAFWSSKLCVFGLSSTLLQSNFHIAIIQCNNGRKFFSQTLLQFYLRLKCLLSFWKHKNCPF